MTNHKVLFILNNLLDIALVFVLTINLYNIAMRNVYHEQIPKIWGVGYAIVISGSMSPAFDVDDIVYIKEQPSYKVGDIVTFTDENSPEKSLVTHRIVKETSRGFVTKGDANNTEDGGYVQASSIHGKVVLVLPLLGASVLWMRTPVGTLAVILLSLLFIELPYQIRTRSKRASQKTIKEIRGKFKSADSAEYAPDLYEDAAQSEKVNFKRQDKFKKHRKKPKVYVPEEKQWNIDD